MLEKYTHINYSWKHARASTLPSPATLRRHVGRPLCPHSAFPYASLGKSKNQWLQTVVLARAPVAAPPASEAMGKAKKAKKQKETKPRVLEEDSLIANGAPEVKMNGQATKRRKQDGQAADANRAVPNSAPAAAGDAEASTSQGRPYTLSMAVAASTIDNAQNMEQATFIAGQVGSGPGSSQRHLLRRWLAACACAVRNLPPSLVT